ncbi:MAG: baseplate J/gp47 family protein [Patescibacteria group bacterium]
MNSFNSQRKVSDIIPPSRNRVLSPKRQFDIEKPKKQNEKPLHLPNLPKFPKKFKGWKALLVVLAILVVYIAVSFMFAKMKLELTPKSVSLPIDEVLELSKNPKSGELLFSEISLSSKKNGEFQSTEKRNVASKARGTITVKNDSGEPQVLVSNTRFQSPSGKIYRIEKQIIVPKLGSLDVEIAADKAGPEYNEENLVDFMLPGLKEQNSPKFKTIYGKSKTKITGGFSGTSLVVSEGDIKNARAKILNSASLETKEDLVRKLPPESFLLAQSIRYLVSGESAEPKAGSPSEKFSFEISGAATGAMVNRKSLEKHLARKSNFYDNSYHVAIKNIEDLSFELMDFKSGADKFKVKIKGTAQLEAEADKDLILDEIFKNKINRSASILTAFPSLERAKVSFRPFWLRSFPKSPDGIDIKITSR